MHNAFPVVDSMNNQRLCGIIELSDLFDALRHSKEQWDETQQLPDGEEKTSASAACPGQSPLSPEDGLSSLSTASPPASFVLLAPPPPASSLTTAGPTSGRQ